MLRDACFSFFFFQAEDGIRDWSVTGVQTCALPISFATGRKRLNGEALSFGERLLDPLLDKLVRDKVRARFGGRLKAMVSGGAPLNQIGRASCRERVEMSGVEGGVKRTKEGRYTSEA